MMRADTTSDKAFLLGPRMKHHVSRRDVCQHATFCWLGAAAFVGMSAAGLMLYAIDRPAISSETEPWNEPAPRPAMASGIEASAADTVLNTRDTRQAAPLDREPYEAPSVAPKPDKDSAIPRSRRVATTTQNHDTQSAVVLLSPPAAAIEDTSIVEQSAAAPTDEGPASVAEPRRERVVARGIATTRRTHDSAAATPQDTPTITPAPVVASPATSLTDDSGPTAEPSAVVPSIAEMPTLTAATENQPPASQSVEAATPQTGDAIPMEEPERTDASQDDRFETPMEAEVAVDSASRVIGWINIGYSGDDAADHFIGRGLKQHGWSRVIERDIVPQLEWGVRRVMIHNPFGSRSDRVVMQFDQYLEAKDAGLDWAVADFAPQWRRVIRGAYTDGEPVEVIGYIGSIVEDRQMAALIEAGEYEAWRHRAEASVAPLIEAGMSIAFDAGSLIPADHLAYGFLRDLQRRGVTVYSETYPKIDSPHLHDIPAIVLERYLTTVANNRSLFPSKSQLGQPISRIINGFSEDEDNPDWAAHHAVRVLTDGDTVITNLNWLVRTGWTKERLLERVELVDLGVYD
jgi:hypothetical protein